MQNILIEQVKKLALDHNLQQINILIEYFYTLKKWNKVYNLCADASDLHILGYHLLDSLSVVNAINLKDSNVLDLGTGAGLPGIPLAIMLPNVKFTLLDSRSKKIIFLQHIINKLKLKNITLELTRVENYHPMHKFDVVISRGFSELEKFVDLSARLIKEPNGTILAMKSDPNQYSVGARFLNKYVIKEIREIKVPLVKAKRCLVFINNYN